MNDLPSFVLPWLCCVEPAGWGDRFLILAIGEGRADDRNQRWAFAGADDLSALEEALWCNM
eukprot:6434215-Amphidinium_carterae.1